MLFCIAWNLLTCHYRHVQDQRTNEIVLKAMGQAISKTVAIAEIIKVLSVLCHFNLLSTGVAADFICTICMCETEENSWVASRYIYQLNYHNWCIWAPWRGSTTVSSRCSCFQSSFMCFSQSVDLPLMYAWVAWRWLVRSRW